MLTRQEQYEMDMEYAKLLIDEEQAQVDYHKAIWDAIEHSDYDSLKNYFMKMSGV